jgi:hypothetical protein
MNTKFSNEKHADIHLVYGLYVRNARAAVPQYCSDPSTAAFTSSRSWRLTKSPQAPSSVSCYRQHAHHLDMLLPRVRCTPKSCAYPSNAHPSKAGLVNFTSGRSVRIPLPPCASCTKHLDYTALSLDCGTTSACKHILTRNAKHSVSTQSYCTNKTSYTFRLMMTAVIRLNTEI